MPDGCHELLVRWGIIHLLSEVNHLKKSPACPGLETQACISVMDTKPFPFASALLIYSAVMAATASASVGNASSDGKRPGSFFVLWLKLGLWSGIGVVVGVWGRGRGRCRSYGVAVDEEEKGRRRGTVCDRVRTSYRARTGCMLGLESELRSCN